MKDFDKYLKAKASEEQSEIPDFIKTDIEQTLSALPESVSKNKKIKIFPRVAAAAACFLIFTLVLLPNISVVYAQTLENIPIIKNIVRVVTIRNYFYSDENHDMHIKVPQIESEENDAADYINKDVNELTTVLVNQFYKDLEINGNNGHGSIYVDYEAITNTDRWFTLKLTVNEIAASSNTYYKFYHIDKSAGKIIKLGDLFKTDDYSAVLADEIKKQMKQQMENDENIIYWVNDAEIGKDFAYVDAEHNFYFNSNGELVIVFDKYEVAPGSMGTPEFAIKKEITDKILKSDYKNIIG